MDATLFKRIWPVFVGEAREHLQQIGDGVLALERDPASRPAGALESVRRTAHSLKGSAASLGLDDLEQLAHGVEDALAAMQAGSRLEGARVEALLAAVTAAEEALARGDAGGEPKVADLAAVMQRLTGARAAPAAPVDEVSAAAAQLWPIFESEAREQLESLRGALGPHSEPPGTLVRLAGSLRNSAATLGLAELERLAGSIEDRLAAAADNGGLDRVNMARLAAELDALDAAIAAGPGGGSPPAAAAEPPPPAAEPSRPARQVFREESARLCAELEAALSRLCAPHVQDRAALLDEARRLAHTLKGSAGAVGAGEVCEGAARLREILPRLATPGLDASRAAAAAAGELVGLREALARFFAEPAAATRDAVCAPVAHEHPAAAPASPAAAAAPAAPAPAPSVAAAPGDASEADRTIRVSVGSIESVAQQVEALVLGRTRQERRARELLAHASAAGEVAAALESARARGAADASALARLRALQRALARMGQEVIRESEQARLAAAVVREDLKDLRMVPAATVLDPLHRTVREVAARVGKQVELALEGGAVRLDRRVLDVLKDPLLHLVRNAVDHGLEAPAARRAAGKPEAGRLSVTVERRGHRIAVIVGDDGAGLSAERIRGSAVRHGLLSPQQAAALDDAEAVRLIFRPGLSTAEQVTAISGRGVGLDVVQAVVTRLGGAVDVDFEPGRGTRFTLDLPLTLAAALAVVVRVGGELGAIPYETVERILRLAPDDLGTVAGRAVARVGDEQLPYAILGQVLGAAPGEGLLPPTRARGQAALLVNVPGHRLVLAVDEVLSQQEIVVHPLGRHLSSATHLGGAAVLDDGRVVAVLNVYELARTARPPARGSAAARSVPRVLVADDSLTTRSAMRALLEIAGYDVVPASDGEEAWGLMQGDRFALVVSDVQMPRLDGLGLTRRIKGDARFAATPVVLVTSLDAPTDRAAGLDAGADGYLVKREVERGKLLELIRQLLPSRA